MFKEPTANNVNFKVILVARYELEANDVNICDDIRARAHPWPTTPAYHKFNWKRIIHGAWNRMHTHICDRECDCCCSFCVLCPLHICSGCAVPCNRTPGNWKRRLPSHPKRFACASSLILAHAIAATVPAIRKQRRQCIWVAVMFLRSLAPIMRAPQLYE